MSVFRSFVLVMLFGLAANNLHAATGIFSGYTMELNGDSAIVGGILRLTPDEGFKRGSAFIVTPFDIEADTSFSTYFKFNMYGTDGTSGADGITFILQNDPAGANAPLVLGNLGYINMPNSIAVEYDTFKSRDPNDPNDNHIGVDVNGDVESLITNISIPDLNNGNAYYSWIDYDGATNLLSVYLNDIPTKPSSSSLSVLIDITQYVTDKAYVGFGASNGNPKQAHDIEEWVLDISTALNIVEVPIDIKPGSDPVCNGVIPVAILGSDTLDVIQIDQTTLSFEGLGVRERGNGALSCNIKDANSDGYTDLVCRYQDTTTEGTLTGKLLDGTPIEGADTFCVVN